MMQSKKLEQLNLDITKQNSIDPSFTKDVHHTLYSDADLVKHSLDFDKL